jgi:TrmH family RNA methyltransferase
VIILDSVQNPGNAGTIIRTTDALCNADIILTGDCADIYSGKTQRAAMGAIFRQNIKICKNIKKELAFLKESGYNIFATYLDKSSRSIENVKFNEKSAVVFGNEGSGLSAETADLCDDKIIIPINPESESLNVSVAAGIVLWEIRKTIE